MESIHALVSNSSNRPRGLSFKLVTICVCVCVLYANNKRVNPCLRPQAWVCGAPGLDTCSVEGVLLYFVQGFGKLQSAQARAGWQAPCTAGRQGGGGTGGQTHAVRFTPVGTHTPSQVKHQLLVDHVRRRSLSLIALGRRKSEVGIWNSSELAKRGRRLQ